MTGTDNFPPNSYLIGDYYDNKRETSKALDTSFAV